MKNVRMFRLLSPVVILLSLALLPACISKDIYKNAVLNSYVPVVSEQTLGDNACLTTTYVLSPEMISLWKKWLNPNSGIEKYRAGMREVIFDDMMRSRLFLRFIPSDDQTCDILLNVDARESRNGDEFLLATALTVIDPGTQDVVSRYERESSLGNAMLQFGDNYKKNLARMLGGLRADLASDYRKRGGRFVSTRRYLLQADEQAKAGDYRRALGSLKEALRAAPKEPEGYAKAASLLLRLCDPEGAARVAEEGLKFAADSGALKELSVRARARGVENLPDANPAACRAQALHREGVALAKEGKSTEALGKFEAALATSPAPLPKARYNIALLLERAGRAGEAVSQLRAAQGEFLLPGEEAEALSRVSALARRANLPVPESADHRYRIGVVRAQQKKYAEAVREFEAALQDAPWFADAYYNLGLVADQAGEPAKALSALRTYRELAPQSPNLGAVKTKIVELEDKLGLLTPAGSSPIGPPAAR